MNRILFKAILTFQSNILFKVFNLFNKIVFLNTLMKFITKTWILPRFIFEQKSFKKLIVIPYFHKIYDMIINLYVLNFFANLKIFSKKSKTSNLLLLKIKMVILSLRSIKK